MSKFRSVILSLLRLLVSLLVLSFCLYALLYLSTGDPALIFLRERGIEINKASLEQTRQSLGISGNFTKDYTNWLINFLKGDFGRSFSSGEDVRCILIERGRVSLYPLVVSYLITAPLSLIIGLILGNILDEKVRKTGLIILSIILSSPVYWLSLLLIDILGIRLGKLPFVGSSSYKHLILPILANSLPSLAHASKLISDEIRNSRDKDSHKIARFRNIKRYYRLYYQLKDISVPLVSIMSNLFLWLMGNSYLIEVIFSISGWGKLLLDSISRRDYPIILALSLITGAISFTIYYLSEELVDYLSKGRGS